MSDQLKKYSRLGVERLLVSTLKLTGLKLKAALYLYDLIYYVFIIPFMEKQKAIKAGEKLKEQRLKKYEKIENAQSVQDMLNAINSK